MIRIRRDVESLARSSDPADQAVLGGYAEAVRMMKDLDKPDGSGVPTNPLSWRFQAAIHGALFIGDPLWATCRHSSWWFLAWHRMYLYRFEQIVGQHLGDPSWALPYWDYTKPDEDARRLPAPFRDPGSALYEPNRNPPANSGSPLGGSLPGSPFDPRGFADARNSLRLRVFSVRAEDPLSSFGGAEVADQALDGRARGALENVPHGTMHGAVGGLMGSFATAGLDPIFWLHHANIDRLWEVWLSLGNQNPTDPAWLLHRDRHYDGSGQPQDLKIEQVTDILALGYAYETTAPPSDFRPPAAGVGAFAERTRLEREDVVMPTPEMVGAARNISLSRSTTVEVPLAERSGVASEAFAPDNERWILRVEGIRGSPSEAAAYAVFLGAEGAELMPIGAIGAFGIQEASVPGEAHDGGGLTDVFDITDTVRQLEDQDAWNPESATVTLLPVGPTGEEVPGGDVGVERISIYRG